jgi:predicted amidohydrolase
MSDTGSKKRLLAAVVQMTSRGNVADNLNKASGLLMEAARRGAELAVLPENFALLTADDGIKRLAAEGIPGEGPILSTMRAFARRYQMALVLGSMPEAGNGERIHNTCVYVDEAGEVKAVYRKIHLFDVAIPDGATYRESTLVAPGTTPVWAQTAWGKLGLSVCYDVRFPELYRQLSAAGVRMLTVPAAFTVHTGRDHWHPLLRARAIENLCFVLAAAQQGRHDERRVTYGHSLIVDPWGQILAEVGDHEGVALAELDFDYQDQLRRELPSLDHRRL